MNLNNTLQLSFLLVAVLLNPIGDAIRDNGNKSMQKNMEALRDMFILAFLHTFHHNWLWTITAGGIYLNLRLALHNLAYNLVADLPWWFVGSTSLTDDVEAQVLKSFSKWQILFARALCLCMAGFLFWLGFIKN